MGTLLGMIRRRTSFVLRSAQEMLSENTMTLLRQGVVVIPETVIEEAARKALEPGVRLTILTLTEAGFRWSGRVGSVLPTVIDMQGTDQAFVPDPAPGIIGFRVQGLSLAADGKLVLRVVGGIVLGIVGSLPGRNLEPLRNRRIAGLPFSDELSCRRSTRGSAEAHLHRREVRSLIFGVHFGRRLHESRFGVRYQSRERPTACEPGSILVGSDERPRGSRSPVGAWCPACGTRSISMGVGRLAP